ncbi:MAG TPA: DUF975 family protein, partial [Candidatus Paceibacterota bacterium]|nr:DUF975 family protein [Candidatus Paceibacterota bacterium]
MKPFSIKESLKKGWELVKAHFGLLIGATLVYLAFSSSGRALAGNNGHIVGWSIPLFLILIVISIIIHIGYYKLYLKLVKGERVSISELFTNYSLFWRYLGGNILAGLVTMVGFILLIVPGIYFAVKYSFTSLLVIDQDLGPVEAFKKSAELTKGIKWYLLLFWLTLIGINIVGVIVFVVGLLVTIPLSYAAYIYVYRAVIDAKGALPAEEVPMSPAPADPTQ